MTPRGKQGKATPADKAAKAAESFNFFQGCNTSAHPDWAAGLCKFKLIRKRSLRAKNSSQLSTLNY